MAEILGRVLPLDCQLEHFHHKKSLSNKMHVVPCYGAGQNRSHRQVSCYWYIYMLRLEVCGKTCPRKKQNEIKHTYFRLHD